MGTKWKQELQSGARMGTKWEQEFQSGATLRIKISTKIPKWGKNGHKVATK